MSGAPRLLGLSDHHARGWAGDGKGTTKWHDAAVPAYMGINSQFQ